MMPLIEVRRSDAFLDEQIGGGVAQMIRQAGRRIAPGAGIDWPPAFFMMPGDEFHKALRDGPCKPRIAKAFSELATATAWSTLQMMIGSTPSGTCCTIMRTAAGL